MSFQEIRQATSRLNRSELSVPGSRVELFEKAAKSAVDVIFLDLEDAVATLINLICAGWVPHGHDPSGAASD